MTIWIDICHTPQFNFYKPLITTLSKEGHQVFITVLERGRTPLIVKRETETLTNVSVIVIGRHKMTKLSAIVDANLIRIGLLWCWARRQKIDIALSNCMAAMIVGKLLNIPRYAFDDDPQTIDFVPKKITAIQSNYCLYEAPEVKTGSVVQVLRCLKEWAYLSPRVFGPNIKALEQYGVEPKKYIFLREVTVGTVNYAGQQIGAIRNIQTLIEQLQDADGKKIKVLFSLEEKNKRNLYPDDWILLQEPVQDIHSLIYYSLGLVSSGDSMAREAALLGVPAYYLGIRYSMPANRAAAKVAKLQNERTMNIQQWLQQLNITPELALQQQKLVRQQIDNDFIDINWYMLNLVHTA